MKHTPEYVLVGSEWHENTLKLDFDSKPLFVTNGSNIKVFHGDSYWTFPDDRRTNANRMIACRKWDYSDTKPRFKTEEEIKAAMAVYNLVAETSA